MLPKNDSLIVSLYVTSLGSLFCRFLINLTCWLLNALLREWNFFKNCTCTIWMMIMALVRSTNLIPSLSEWQIRILRIRVMVITASRVEISSTTKCRSIWMFLTIIIKTVSTQKYVWNNEKWWGVFVSIQHFKCSSDGSNTILSNIKRTCTSFFEHWMNSNMFIYWWSNTNTLFWLRTIELWT